MRALTNPSTLRLVRTTMGAISMSLALLALVCAGAAWAAEAELRRQESYRTADDQERNATNVHE